MVQASSVQDFTGSPDCPSPTPANVRSANAIQTCNEGQGCNSIVVQGANVASFELRYGIYAKDKLATYCSGQANIGALSATVTSNERGRLADCDVVSMETCRHLAALPGSPLFVVACSGLVRRDV